MLLRLLSITHPVIAILLFVCTGFAQAQPKIVSLSPQSGPAGTLVKISGTNFGASPTDNVVYFGTARATVKAASPGELTVEVPSAATSVAPVTVATPLNGLSGSSITSTSPWFNVTFPYGKIDPNTYYPQTLVRGDQERYRTATAGDLNGDGKTDLVAISEDRTQTTTNFLVVGYRNAANNGFDAPVRYPLGGFYYQLVLADFNNDGKLDVLAYTYSGAALLLRNAANTGFNAPADLGITRNDHIAAGDLTGDGRTDLAVTYGSNQNLANAAISVHSLKTDYTGVASTTTFSVPSGPTGLALADMNRDGKLDIVTHCMKGELAVIERNATHTGWNAPVLHAGVLPANYNVDAGHVAIGDLNGDGIPDAVVSNTSTVTVVLPGKATGGFDTKTSYNCPGNAAIGDYNGDGKPDIKAGNRILLRNATNTGFDAPVTLAVGSQDIYGNIMDVTGDFNGDGKADLICGTLSITYWVGVSALIYANAPQLTSTDPTSRAFLENSTSAVMPNLTITDLDDTHLTGATVTITPPYDQPDQWELLFTNQNGISGTFDLQTGVLSLSGSATVAQYEAALRSVQYRTWSEFPTTTYLQIYLTARDSKATSRALFRAYTVQPVNDPPTVDAIPDQLITNGGSPLSMLLKGLSAGEPNRKIAITVTSSNPSLLAVAIPNHYDYATSTSLQLTPAAGQTGTALVTLNIKDFDGTAHGGVDEITRTFTVHVTNPPTGVDGTTCGDPAGVVLGASGAMPGDSYRWYAEHERGTALAETTAPSFTTPVVSATTTYYLSLVRNGLESWPRVPVQANRNPYPDKPTVASSGEDNVSATFALNTNGSGSLQWFRNGTAIPDATSSRYLVTQPGSYTVRSTHAGCTSESDPVVLTTTEPGSTPVTTGVLYPNPARDEVRVDVKASPGRVVTARVYNAQGRLLISKGLAPRGNQWQATFDVSTYAPGMYVILLSDGTQQQKYPFIKQ